MDFLGSYYLIDIMPWALGTTVAFILLLIFWKMWRRIVTNKVRRMGGVSGMQMQDADALKKKGLITPEEHRKIRQSMANREMEHMSAQRRDEHEREILAQAEINPDAVVGLLTPEELREGRARKAAGKSRKGLVSPEPPTAQVPARRLARLETPDRTHRPPPATNAPPEPAMNMPRVVQSRRKAVGREQGKPAAPTEGQPPAKSPGELEVLLEKGAISPEEYKRLKEFFQ